MGLLHPDSRNVYLASLLEEIPWIQHGFGAKRTSGWPNPATITTIRQIHSASVVEAEHPGVAGQGDAIITDRAGLTLSVRTADCLPILMVDTRHRALAAVHAGWRGTISGIAPNTVQAMAARFGTQPEDLRIAIGPGIGKCCFEVGSEVAIQFQKLFPERSDLDRRTHLDLIEANRRQLRQLGVTGAQIGTLNLCTVCHPDDFHSFRRDGEAAGRMMSGIGIR